MNLELIFLPGPYTANLFLPYKSETTYFSGNELLEISNKELMTEIYGRLYIRKYKSTVYHTAVKNREELIIICLDGCCCFDIDNEQFTLHQGEQVYVKDTDFTIIISDETILEFIHAPGDKYTDLLTQKQN